MIKFTPEKHRISQKTKARGRRKYCPSKFSVRLIMSYAVAVRVLNTENIGQTNIMLN